MQGSFVAEQPKTPLSYALLIVGLLFIFANIPLMELWPSGWRWEPGHPAYEQMILGIYATLGVFLVWASRDPVRHRSLILFAAWSSLVHAGIMLLHANRDTVHAGHLTGDVPFLAFAGVLLLIMLPQNKTRRSKSRRRGSSR